MYKLDQKKKRILKEIFSGSIVAPNGIEATQFRAQRESLLDLLDELERDGFLRREEGRYLVSLTALTQIGHPFAKESLRAFETIFSAVKEKYRKYQSQPVSVVSLANELGLDLQRLRVWLSYMVEASWWGGRTNDLLRSPDAAITPSESILKARKFRDAIAQLEAWQEQRLSERMKIVPVSQLRQMLPGTGLDRNDVDQALVGRPKPDWYDRLPTGIRDLLNEVYLGIANDMRTLTSIGVRSVIDMTCVDVVGDIGTFANKIDALRSNGHIGDGEATFLRAAIDTGSASAHRGHAPSTEALRSLLDICEHLLKGVYILPEASEQLQQATPQRTPKKREREDQ